VSLHVLLIVPYLTFSYLLAPGSSTSPVYQTPIDQTPTDTDKRNRACSPTWHQSQKISGKVHETFERNVSVESLVGEGYQYEPTIEGIYSEVPSRASSFSIGGNSGMGSMTQFPQLFMETGLNEGRLDGIRREIDVLERRISEIARLQKRKKS
jgi:hypothetical protein